MKALSEVHVFIIRVKIKIALGKRLGKQEKRQNNALRKILVYTSLVTNTYIYVIANFPGRGMSVRNAVINFVLKFHKSAGGWLYEL